MASRALNITASQGRYVHNIAVGGFNDVGGVDTRSAKMAGKLIVTLGVNQGGYSDYLGKRGFHVIGAGEGQCNQIDNWTLGTAYDGDCRLNTLDGMPHGTQNAVTAASSVMGQVSAILKAFSTMYPGEDWGYFLNADGTVRWSDVGFNGYSHGASSASVYAHELCVYRAVSLSGPRDDTCGNQPPFTGPFNPAMPPYNVNCPAAHIADWLSMPSATPIDHYYSFVGEMDVQYGDDQFDIQRQGYVGMPVDINTAAAPYNGTHRFYASMEGHGTFDNDIAALNIAYGVLPENLNPTF